MTIGLHIKWEDAKGKAVIRIEGRLDAASAPTLEKTITDILDKKYLQVLLDFSNVEYLSSAGMRLLLSTAKKLKNQKGNIVLFSVSDEIMEIIKMAGFERILNLCPTEKAAFDFFSLK